MKCPACSESLPAGAERCPGCGAIVGPAVEGALAPNPRTVTPPPRDMVKPLRDIPGLPKKERTWRDEVQERVRRRRKKRAESSLPLFEQPAVVGAEEPPPAPVEEAEPSPQPPTGQRLPAPAEEAKPERSSRPDEGPLGAPALSNRDFEAAPLSEQELADLPLHSEEPAPPVEIGTGPDPEVPPVKVELPSDEPVFDEEPIASGDDGAQEDLSLTPPAPEPSPLERPARVGERAQAAVVDAGILCVLGGLVLYFTGRTARVELLSLAASWPWLVSYLAFLGLFYAGYFTGTSGQTPGKMVTGLRVVDRRGRPPGYLRAAARAAVAAVGTAVAGVGLIPMALDPARRAFHDRLLHTRVVRR
jgi:uncharacterized RDD family membrane protein YckC